jgi:hypothetical protein
MLYLLGTYDTTPLSQFVKFKIQLSLNTFNWWFYFSNEVCDVTITANEGKVIHYRLTFQHLDDEDDSCEYDGLKLYDGKEVFYSKFLQFIIVWKLQQ